MCVLLLLLLLKHLFQQVSDIEELVSLARQHEFCPYYLGRGQAPSSELVLMPYNYLLDPSARRGIKVCPSGPFRPPVHPRLRAFCLCAFSFRAFCSRALLVWLLVFMVACVLCLRPLLAWLLACFAYMHCLRACVSCLHGCLFSRSPSKYKIWLRGKNRTFFCPLVKGCRALPRRTGGRKTHFFLSVIIFFSGDDPRIPLPPL